MKKQYVVFGAGRFGKSVAVTLQSRGCEVVVVDKDPEVIEDIADDVAMRSVRMWKIRMFLKILV